MAITSHTRLSNTFGYHAIEVFSVSSIKDLLYDKDEMSTPYELYYGKTPYLGSYWVSGCPIVAKKYTITNKYGRVTKNTTSQSGTPGFFIGFPHNQQGWLIYIQVPS
jgi:hypothetical protein